MFMPPRKQTTPAELPTDPSSESLPGQAERIHSPDGSVEIAVSPYGGQVVLGRIGDHEVILPLTDKLFGVGTDDRDDPNSLEEGEAARSGGTFLSFGGGQITEEDGTVRKVRIHGPFGAPWYRYRMERLDDSISLVGRWWKSLGRFFRRGEGYSVDRTITAESASGYDEGAMVITNTITSKSTKPFAIPQAVEHTYYRSGLGAAIRDADGQLIPATGIGARHEQNANAIDVRFDSAAIGTPGRCVFLPNGENGHVVVIDATMAGPNGAAMPIKTFCVYRRNPEDQWLAIEPLMDGLVLPKHQSTTMRVSIRTFVSLAAYQASLVPNEA